MGSVTEVYLLFEQPCSRHGFGSQRGKNISPDFGSVTSVKKKLILKFSAVKKLFPLKIFSQIIAMLLYAYLTAVVPIFGK